MTVDSLTNLSAMMGLLVIFSGRAYAPTMSKGQGYIARGKYYIAEETNTHTQTG